MQGDQTTPGHDAYIPRRLDDQWKIGLWDVDVAAPVLFSCFLGFMAGSKLSFALSVGAGLAMARWMRRMKAEKHPAIVLHFLYWYLPPSPFNSLKATPPAAIDRMVG